MKKIIAFCLCAAMLLSIPVCTSAADTESGALSKAEKFMIGTGIFNMEYTPKKVLTRGEFAAILVNALGISERESSSGKAEVTETDTSLEDVTVEKGIFDDVDMSHPYYKEIIEAKQRGVMSGISDRMFAPEYSITLKEAERVILSLIGYDTYADRNGGYPQGYIKTAAELGLTKSITCGTDGAMTQIDAVNLVYNALDVKLLEVSDFGSGDLSKGSETFMTGIMKLGRQKGVMTDNGFTSLGGASAVGVGYVQVGLTAAKISDNVGACDEMLAHTVEMYYVTDDFNDNTAVYIEDTGKDDIITFSAEDFMDFDGNTISYKKNGAKYSRMIDRNAELIINNEVQVSFNKSSFDFYDGYIHLINNGGGYNIIIADKYEYAIVSSIDSSKRYIFNQMRSPQVSSKYDLSGNAAESNAIIILDENGSKIAFEDIKTGDILNIRQSANFIKIIRAGSTVDNCVIEAMAKDDSSTTYVTADGEYSASRIIDTYTNSQPVNIGSAYRLYLNMAKKVIWVESESAAAENKIGVLVRIKYYENEVEDKQRYIKIYGRNKTFEGYYTDEKIKVNGSKCKFETAAELLGDNIGELVMYSVDENGKLTDITTASEIGTNAGHGWYKIAAKGKYRFESDASGFSTMFYSNSSTEKFVVPNSEADRKNEEKYSYNSIKFKNTDYTVEAYSKDKDSITVDAVLVNVDYAREYDIDEQKGLLITAIKNTINEDDEPIVVFEGYEFGLSTNAKHTKYALAGDVTMVDANMSPKPIDQEASFETVGPKSYKDIKKGDIIYFSLNYDDEIKDIRMAYDCSEKRAFNARVHTDDFYDREYDGTYLNCDNTTWSGTVISAQGTGVRFAMNHNPAAIRFNDKSDVEKNVRAVVVRNTGSVFVVEGTDSDAQIRTATVDEIRGYNDTGTTSDADDIVFLSYRRSLNYGTIIYRDE